MIKIITCALLFALAASIGCTKAIDRSMVVGKYNANHNKGSDSLELRADGVYLHHYTSADGKELANTNRWKFEYQDGKPIITFVQFAFSLPGYGTKYPGFWIVEVKKSIIGNTLHLCIDPDLGYSYIKQN